MFKVGDKVKVAKEYSGGEFGVGYIGYEAKELELVVDKLDIPTKKLHPEAVIPFYSTIGSACFDLVAVEDIIIQPGETKKIPTGLAFQIPEGYVMFIFPRSGISFNTPLRLPNSVGVIDSDYRGEVQGLFHNTISYPQNSIHNCIYRYKIYDIKKQEIETNSRYAAGTYIVRKGDKIAQALVMPYPKVLFQEVEELSETDRGSGGFGSTGGSI